MMRAIISEDEPLARQAIVAMAASYGIHVVAECQDGTETLHCVRACRPDLLFLDVEMPGIDGFEVLRAVLTDGLPAVIFTTAFDRYAVRAFEHNAVDYLLKPFDEERFCKAVDRARDRLANRTTLTATMRPSLDAMYRPQLQSAPQRLVVRSRRGVELLRIDDIDWIEAQHNYVQLHVGNVVHSLRQAIGQIEARLRPDSFLRIHRSLIVNVDRIRRLEACGYGEYLVLLHSGKSLPLSRGYRDRLDGLLNRISASPELSHIGQSSAKSRQQGS